MAPKLRIRLKYRGRPVTFRPFRRVRSHLRIAEVRLGGRFGSYLRENWGSPFIVAFMVLLMAAAGWLAAGLEALANEVAVYAYYSLVVGVALQLVCYLKHGGDGE